MINVSVRRKKKKNPGSVPVYLNVYDLTPMNVYGYWLGIGIYHSGLEVHGVEYGYGAHEHSSTGIFKVEPKKCPGFTFRKSILVGETEMKAKEVGSFMEELADEYQGSKYHLITRNCNHFCNDVCLKLTQKSIPSWVNRLARLGFPLTISQEKVSRRHFSSFSFAHPQLHIARLQDAVPQVVYDKEEAGQKDEAKQAYPSLDSSSYRQHYQVQCQAQALAQNQARILSGSSRLFVFCSI
ncbi:LOW QUALITY PROTEIN: hypothetical protein HID58_040557 [Brassica napus]|uniref:PPPDE domain-containing protein n=1 Tax=Brassica napus TaxID=3708 RepID=A0ABQ8B8D7_BRANA|nr:LOW QUALITY PROTEIN: hypothetical protein HID58_040557 [Brassica napus]